ncbi:hypothetical protein [Natrinema thermotolerans]
MPAKPPLPDGYELPESVNGWQHDPESSKNAHVWTGPEGTASVGVFESVGDEVYAKVVDPRAGAGEELFRLAYDPGDATGAAYTDAIRGAVREGVERAREWMRSTAPSEWSHPDVCEAVFDAPAGYTLERYFHGNRESIVYYRRTDAVIDQAVGRQLPRCSRELGIGILIVDAKLTQCDGDQEVLATIVQRHHCRWPRLPT